MSRQMMVEEAIRRAHAALAAGDREEASARMGAASLARIPEQCLRTAQLYLHLGDLEAAAIGARRAVRYDPYLAPAWSVLGYALMRQGNSTEAERALRRALELDPSLPQPHTTQGTIAAQRGDYAAAAAAFARSLELDPGQPEVEGMMRRAGVCAAVQATPVEGVSIPDLQRLLTDAAACGFPDCMREWLGSGAWPSGDGRNLAEAYLRAEAAVRSQGGNKAQ
jgi:tetratricopeptide (TPR) repeat protein